MGEHDTSYKVDDMTTTINTGNQFNLPSSPSFTIHASSAGENIVGGKSTVGHVFLSVHTYSYSGTIGFSMGESVRTSTDNISFNDHNTYINASTHTITSQNSQFVQMLDTLAGIFQAYESGSRTPKLYNLLNSNSIDFVQNTLSEAGIKLTLSGTPDGVVKNIQHLGSNFTTPLVIDLFGEGVQTISIDEGVLFNYDNDTTPENTGWIGSSSGFLVVDINKDGIINDATELFGDRTVLSDGSIAQDGVQAIRSYDSNFDGKINQEDDIWKDLLVWIDNNEDGYSSSNELIDLDTLGIESISLDFDNTKQRYDQNGNFHGDTATVHWSNGKTTDITDVFFKTNINKPSENYELQPTIDNSLNDLLNQSGNII